ncbi:MAG: membrane protein insertion efficiency factor YidD [Sedimentisphaerales bacterium]
MAKETIIFAIRLYQSSLGLFLGGQCRFVPSCSEYAIEAVRQFGAVKGSYMAVKRILRCHPFSRGGFDPPSVNLRRAGPPL